MSQPTEHLDIKVDKRECFGAGGFICVLAEQLTLEVRQIVLLVGVGVEVVFAIDLEHEARRWHVEVHKKHILDAMLRLEELLIILTLSCLFRLQRWRDRTERIRDYLGYLFRVEVAQLLVLSIFCKLLSFDLEHTVFCAEKLFLNFDFLSFTIA